MCNYGQGRTLTVIDVATGTVTKTLDLGVVARPHGIQLFPDGKRIAVTAETRRALLIIDLESGKVIATVPTDQAASHMVALSPDGKRAYVANIRPGTVSVLDLETAALKKIVRTGAGAEGVAVRPGTGEIWVSSTVRDMFAGSDRRFEDRGQHTLKGVPGHWQLYIIAK